MNYLVKQQPAPGGMVMCLLNTSTRSRYNYYFCGNCLRHHPVFRNNVQKSRISNYISAVKVQLEKKGISEKKENIPKRINTESHAKKLTEMLKIMPPKISRKQLLTNVKRLSGSGVSRSRYNVDCTKSYDPNMLNCNLDILKPVGINNDFQGSTNSNSIKTIRNQDVIHTKFKKLSHNVSSNFKQNPTSTWNSLQLISIPQKHTSEDFIIKNTKTSSTELKINEEQLCEKPEAQDQQQENIFERKAFIVTLTREASLLQFLHSSVDICITHGMVKEACELFQNYREKVKWQLILKNKYRTVQDVYNSLLHALSSKGYWYVMKKLTDWMKEDGIKLNCESFAAMLHCLANVRKSGNEDFILQEVPKVLNLIFMNNISLNDIFCKSTLSKEASDRTLAIVREVVPSFEIQPDVIELSSDCSLLKTLHYTSSNLQPQLDNVSGEDLERFVEEQLQLEKDFYLSVKAISRGRSSEVPPHVKAEVESLKNEWRAALTRAVNSLKSVPKPENLKSSMTFHMDLYLNSVPVDKIVDILMETTQTVIEYSRGYSPSCHQFHRIISSKIFQCYQLRKKHVTRFTDKTAKLFKKYVYWYANPSGPAMNSRQKWQMLIQDSERSDLLDPHVIKWPDEVLLKVGKIFLNIILREVKFPITTDSRVTAAPVLHTILRYRESTFRDEIKCHPSVSDLFNSIGFDVLHFPSEEVPMVCPPKPWKSAEHGGYLSLPTDFIRQYFGLQGKTICLKDVPVQQLYATFDSLNALQSVPWMINEDVLDVALEVFQSGGSEKLCVPLLPTDPPPREKFAEGMTYVERRKLHLKREEHVKDLKNNYSLWCEALYRLSLANHFRKKVFWMPQNCDFRGRVYPVPPLINHLGSDLFRSLLVFAKGKPLGPKGLDWLKIHLINLTGTHKKKSVKERLDYANEILPDILDSAENPLTGKKWWTESDDPWQTLATCMELKKAISSPNPETYICRFPIHQDGSCNGLQHYAALGKDSIGAKSVNLVPCDRPQDVYSVVVGLVEEERAKDAANGIGIAQILEGFVERKVVKQTVMTTVYGVTSYGAKLQIARRLEEIPNFPPDHTNAAALYLTQKTFYCLKKMFTSARQIQEWFISCADEICHKDDYVQWISPLGLPVLQSYAKYRTSGKSRSKYIVPDRLKQKNAFPPNFIHSLDSCHMMLTSLYCERAGLTFAAVHDCFWTHPVTVDIMNRICREQFISLHSQTILEDLSQFFKKTYTNGSNDEAAKIFESVPEKGEFDIKEVLNSVYFFS